MKDHESKIKSLLAKLFKESGIPLYLETSICSVCGKAIYRIGLDGYLGGIYLPHSNLVKLDKAVDFLGMPLLYQAVRSGAFGEDMHSSLKVILGTEVPTMALIVTPKEVFKGFHKKSVHEPAGD